MRRGDAARSVAGERAGMRGPELRTERLLLRRWRAGDLGPFAELNADPRVMEHYPATLSRAESDALVERMEAELDREGYGIWALEIAEDARFVGSAGLSAATFEAHFTPAVEVGWRLIYSEWGKGYATEAARRSLRFAFEELGLEEVVSFTATTNWRSQAVMRRLGMTHDEADDFDHPRLPPGHRLRRHVLYRIGARAWQTAGAPT